MPNTQKPQEKKTADRGETTNVKACKVSWPDQIRRFGNPNDSAQVFIGCVSSCRIKKKGVLFADVKKVRLENVVAAAVYEGKEETLVGVESFKKA